IPREVRFEKVSLVAPPVTDQRSAPEPFVATSPFKVVVPRPSPATVALPAAPVPIDEPARVRIGTADGQTTIARVYGGEGSRIVELPDGRLGWPNELVRTNEPFQPVSADELAKLLQNGPYRHFGLVRTDHYLVFHTGTVEFAKQSGQMLES